MTPHKDVPPLERRSFLARFGAGVAAFGAAMVGADGALGAQAPAKGWTPVRHAQDDWFDQLPGKHRFFFDATTPTGVGEAITFATNYYVASKSGYGLEERESAVVICLRHWATPFAFADPLWAKYGVPMAGRIKFSDPKTQQAPTTNVYRATGYGMQLPNRGTTLDQMVERGTHYAVCDMATRAFAGVIATAFGAKADEIYQEMRAAAIPNTHFVPAGIVAVNRAQERGYAIQYIG